jgi:hypothetical protein
MRLRNLRVGMLVAKIRNKGGYRLGHVGENARVISLHPANAPTVTGRGRPFQPVAIRVNSGSRPTLLERPSNLRRITAR